MLNLSQRLILGCLVLVGLTAGLVIATHRTLAAAGQSRLAYIFLAATVLVAAGPAAKSVVAARTVAKKAMVVVMRMADAMLRQPEERREAIYCLGKE